MTCRELIEFLWRYVEDGLRPEERSQFDDHLAKCPDCVKYVQSYRETVRAGQVVFRELEDAVPAEVPEDLVQAILAARTKVA